MVREAPDSAASSRSRWTTVAEGQATGQLTTVSVRPTLARHLRISSTRTAGNWWSLADIRLYR